MPSTYGTRTSIAGDCFDDSDGHGGEHSKITRRAQQRTQRKHGAVANESLRPADNMYVLKRSPTSP